MGGIYCRITRGFQVFLVGVITLNVCLAEVKKESLMTRLQQQTSQVDKNIKSLTNDIYSLQKDVEELRQKVESLNNETSEVSSSLVELNRKIERINNDIISILQKIEELSKEISYLKREDIEIKQNIEQLSKEKIKSEIIATSFETQTATSYDINNLDVLTKKINELKKEIQEIKEMQKLQTVPEIKNPNLRRILTSPYLVLTSLIISIFALLATFF